MGSFKVSIRPLPISFNRFERNTINEIVLELRKRKVQIEASIREVVHLEVYNALINSEETSKLLSKIVIQNLGIPDLEQRLVKLYKFISESIYTNIQIARNPFMKVTLGILESDYTKILSLPESSFVYEAGLLNWLEWLLKNGTRPTITTHFYLSGTNKGRAGGGIMVKGGTWSVPPHVAGVEGDNFITRALDDTDGALIKIIENTIERGLK